MTIDHEATFGRRAARSDARAAMAPSGLEKCRRARLAVQRRRLGVLSADDPNPVESGQQWQALGVAPLSGGGATGMPMAPTDAVRAVDFVPKRAVPVAAPVAAVQPAAAVTGPLRIRGRVGDGLYWSLRTAGASPQIAAEYLAALATEIDVGDVASNDGFDLVLGPQPRTAVRRARPHRAGRASAGSLDRQRAERMGRCRKRRTSRADDQRPCDAGQRPDHLLLRLSLSPDPALHPLPRGRRHRRRLGKPDRRRG